MTNVNIYTISVSITMFGAFLGAMVGGLQSQLLGRKKSLMASSLCALAAITSIRFAKSFPVLLVGRFLMGYGGGSEMPASSAYTAEVCHPNIRKFTGTFGGVLYTIGYAILYLLGAFFQWRDTLSIIMGWPIICIIALFFCPESPTWLMLKDKKTESFNAMLRLRGNEEDANTEIKNIEANIKQQNTHIKYSNTREKFLTILRLPTFWRPFLVLLVLMTLGMQFTGAPPLAFYLVPILQKSNIPISSYVAAASLAVFRVLVVMMSTFLCTIVPRRKLLMGTLFISSTGALLMGSNAYLEHLPWFQEIQTNYPLLKWTPMVSIFLMYLGFSGGVGNVIQTLNGELLPSNLRSFGIGLVTVFSMGSLFIVLKYTPLAEQNIGLHGMYWTFSVTGYGLIAFTFFFIPETFGRSLEAIEDHYRKLCYGEDKVDILKNEDNRRYIQTIDSGSIENAGPSLKVNDNRRLSLKSQLSFSEATMANI